MFSHLCHLLQNVITELGAYASKLWKDDWRLFLKMFVWNHNKGIVTDCNHQHNLKRSFKFKKQQSCCKWLFFCCWIQSNLWESLTPWLSITHNLLQVGSLSAVAWLLSPCPTLLPTGHNSAGPIDRVGGGRFLASGTFFLSRLGLCSLHSCGLHLIVSATQLVLIISRRLTRRLKVPVETTHQGQ